MCSFIPANVGEKSTGQLRTRHRIQKAVDASVRAEMPKKTKRTLAQQKRLSKWAGAKMKLKRKRPKSIV